MKLTSPFRPLRSPSGFLLLSLIAITLAAARGSTHFVAPQKRIGAYAFEDAGAVLRAYVTRISNDRSQILEFHLANPTAPGSGQTKAVAVLRKVEVFDALTGKLLRAYAPSANIDEAPVIANMPCQRSAGEGCGFPKAWSVGAEQLGTGFFYFVFRDSLGHVSRPVFAFVNPANSGTSQPRLGILFPDHTWQAYNLEGGQSFYHPTPADRHFRISELRPLPALPPDLHSPEPTLALIREAKKLGYIVHGLTHTDLESGIVGHGFQALLVTGHDEYWTESERLNLVDFIRAGGNVGIFSGNTMFWRINRLEHELLIAKRKPSASDAATPFADTGYFHEMPNPTGMEQISGLTFRQAGYPLQREFDAETAAELGVTAREYAASSGMRVLAPAHPLFAGTDLKKGEWFGVKAAITDYELDGRLMTAPSAATGLAPDDSTYPKPLAEGYGTRGGKIFRTALIAENHIGQSTILHFGSIGWYQGLLAHDPAVVTITNNALRLLMAPSAPATTPEAGSKQ